VAEYFLPKNSINIKNIFVVFTVILAQIFLTTNLINDKNIFRIYCHFSPVKVSHFSVAEYFLTKNSINIKNIFVFTVI